MRAWNKNAIVRDANIYEAAFPFRPSVTEKSIKSSRDALDSIDRRFRPPVMRADQKSNPANARGRGVRYPVCPVASGVSFVPCATVFYYAATLFARWSSETRTRKTSEKQIRYEKRYENKTHGHEIEEKQDFAKNQKSKV